MTDPFARNQAAFRYEMRASFAISNPAAHIDVPTEGLPEPLRRRADAMKHGTADERKAAAQEFLTLSEEWL
jgi:hypothetical protein